MPEIEDKVIFILETDKLKLITSTDGSRLIISDIDLTRERAASLVYLISSQQDLQIEIKLDS